MTEENRPQTKLDRDFEHGMGICIGRLRDDPKAAQRPALKAGIETLVGGDPLRAEIVALLRERDGLYQKAAHRRLNVNQPLERVFAALEETAREFVRKCRENERPDEAARVVQ